VAVAVASTAFVPRAGVALAAPAGKRPAVEWTISHSPNAGKPVPFTWKVRHLPAHGSLVLQTPEGTGRVWQTISRLGHHSSGSASTPKLSLGVRHLRLAIVHGRKVIAAAAHTLRVYGKVPLKRLLKYPNKGTYTAPTFTFPYVATNEFSGTTANRGIVTDGKSRCRRIVIAGVLGTDGQADTVSGETGTLTVVQQSRNPTSASAGSDQLATVSAKVKPGQSWSLNDAVSNSPYWGGTFYLNGYGICFARSKLS